MESSSIARATNSCITGRRIRLSGVVQGVGFRPWVYRLASEEGISGRVRNDAAGVTIEAFGSTSALDRFLVRLRNERPGAAVITALQWRPAASAPPRGFEIAASRAESAPRPSIPADLAACPRCLDEVFDPRDRRYRYPFANCTVCGPRFTIVREVPYDRASTTMAAFAMCPECRHEYESVADRRFHAEPIACPRCGPRLSLLGAGGDEVKTDDPIQAAARALCRGLIVAVKGLGGFHLACDATNAAAVSRLRDRKRREEKPLAVMVRDIREAELIADLTVGERRLLASVERPIVLARRREGARLAGEVAPANPMVGVMLAYTPLHHLLLAQCARPLVMTSGNLSEEPIAYRNDEAHKRLRGVADLFVIHDREIVTRCDDSVVREVGELPVLMRRSRGYVPGAIAVRRGFSRPVLACGAQLKNTFCFGVAGEAYLGPHIGDLDNLETYASFEESIARMERFLGVVPEVVAHDLHPDYLSTRYALARRDVIHAGVQHHHAHIAACMADNEIDGPVIGVAFDGTGYGTDGNVWGGEFLLADYHGFERGAHLEYVAMPGGAAAIRHAWRMALAHLMAAGEPLSNELASVAAASDMERAVVAQQIRQGVNSPLTSSVGRLFDAVASLIGLRHHASYEAQGAMELEACAAEGEQGFYRFEISDAARPLVVSAGPVIRAIAADLRAGIAPKIIAARFHDSVVRMIVEVCSLIRRSSGVKRVALAGGVFQNARVLAGALRALVAAGFEVFRHIRVPPNDGGIALGQALVAEARLSEEHFDAVSRAGVEVRNGFDSKHPDSAPITDCPAKGSASVADRIRP